MKLITEIHIDTKLRFIKCYDDNRNLMKWPGTTDGGGLRKYAKSSVAGLIIQALVKAIENAMTDGRSI